MVRKARTFKENEALRITNDNVLDAMEKRVFAEPERISSPTTQKIFARKDSFVKIGDVVLIHDNLPRSRWRLALEDKRIEGRDGWFCAAQVKLVTGFNVLCNYFFPLEVQDTFSDHKETKSKETSDPADPPRPSKRKAAIEARQKTHMWWTQRYFRLE